MRENPWQRLIEILEAEKRAIVEGNVERLLECIQEKEVILKDPELKTSPLSREMRERITTLTRHNEMLLKAGLAFIEEAYRFLNKNLAPKVGYGAKGTLKTGRGNLLSLEV